MLFSVVLSVTEEDCWSLCVALMVNKVLFWAAGRTAAASSLSFVCCSVFIEEDELRTELCQQVIRLVSADTLTSISHITETLFDHMMMMMMIKGTRKDTWMFL